jgi:HPt (histidine-containing phosphotransfer) domain-containing protein
VRQLDPDGQDRLLARLIALYRDDSSQLLADIDNAMKTGDAEGVARAAHTLKSSSANLGATNVAAIARQIEHAARGGDLRELPSSFTKLRAQRTVALSELEALVARAQNRLSVELTTSYELSDEDAQSIVQTIEKASGRTVDATRSVDPSLIGGIVLQIGTHRADGSVRGRLERLRHQLATAQ